MSPAPALKHNPGLRGDQDVIDRFTVRQRHYDWILDRIREAGESPSDPCQHLLVVGARGMGKTTLVRRVAAELRRDALLSERWLPIVFPEEAYLPSTAGEFWLEAIFHLAERLDNDDFRRTYLDLRGEPDESRLHDRCLAVLLDHADRAAKRLVLVVENAGMLFGEQISDAAAWKLRQTLSHEPRILMLATATARFEEIDGIDKAWFELFAQHVLEPLSREECTSLWTAVNGEPPEGDSIRAVEILTGGNPRLVTIMAEFSVNRRFRELMDRLIELVDSHTEYFKSHLDALPAQERKVFAVLLDLWAPATAAQVAEHSRLSTNVCSSLLKRLAGRGAVTIAGERKRDRRYQVTERLFNIYYLMRRRGENQQRAEMLVHFMKAVYSSSGLRDVVAGMGRDLWALSPESRKEWFAVLVRLAQEDPRAIRALTPSQLRRLGAPEQLRSARDHVVPDLNFAWAEPAFFEVLQDRSIPAALRARERFESARIEGIHSQRDLSSVAATIGFAALPGGLEEADWWAAQAVDLDPENPAAWLLEGFVNLALSNTSEARIAFERSLNIDPAQEGAWIGLFSAALDDFATAAAVESRWLDAIPHSKVFWDCFSVGLAAVPLPTEFRNWRETARAISRSEAGIGGAAMVLVLSVSALRANQLREFTEALSQHDHDSRLEVPIAALTILAGREPAAPPEVVAVARDLAAKISEAAATHTPPETIS